MIKPNAQEGVHKIVTNRIYIISVLPPNYELPVRGRNFNASNYAKFAFYVSGEEPSTYYIYNETAKKWLSYELKDSYRVQTGFVKMLENKEEVKAFKFSHLYTNRNSQAIACEFLHL